MDDILIRIRIDQEAIGVLEIEDLKYNPETKKIIISGEFLKDSELVKKILDDSKPAFATKAMTGIGLSDDYIVDLMDIHQAGITSKYCDPILDHFKEIN